MSETVAKRRNETSHPTPGQAPEAERSDDDLAGTGIGDIDVLDLQGLADRAQYGGSHGTSFRDRSTLSL